MGLIARNKVFYGNQPNIEVLGGGGGYAPVGTVIAYMGITAPLNYLACDGSVVNIADWPQLAHLFENQFGSANYFGGDGTTTFAVPDLRGEFLRGTGNNSHTNQGNGSNVGTHQDATSIRTGVFVKNGNLVYATSSADNQYQLNVSGADSSFGTQDRAYTVSGSSGTGSGNSLQQVVRPTNTSVLYCIKARSDEPFDPENVYSLNEQKVGYWIDGKPVYQKTFIHTTGATSSNTWEDIAPLPSVDTIVGYFGSSGPSTLTLSGNYFANPSYDDSNEKLRLFHSGMPNRVVRITVQYTKTTD